MFTGEDSTSPPPSLAPSGSCPPPTAARSSGPCSTPPDQTHRPATGCASLNPCSGSSSGLLTHRLVASCPHIRARYPQPATGPARTRPSRQINVEHLPGRHLMNNISSTFIEPATGVIGDKLAGRVALVTGGTRGIGAAICRSLASQGASVAAGYSGNKDRADAFVKEFVRDFDGPGRATTHQGNVSHPEDCRRVVQEVLKEHGRIDILVNNAGITMDKMAMKMSVEDWNTVLAVNLSGSFYMAQPALEHMVERGTGRIIFVSSVIGETGNIG